MGQAQRRLAAVMCADVAQYTRLMERDEDGTLRRLKEYRGQIARWTESHQGRVVNTWGDAVIIEFPSVTNAVYCAVDIQKDLNERNHHLPDIARMDFRIGINLGDIMVEGEDIYGDGVNVAARLQELAPGGGILLSRSVYDQVRSKLALGVEQLGPQAMKNVAEPVDVYRIRLDGRNLPAETVAGPEGAANPSGRAGAEAGETSSSHGARGAYSQSSSRAYAEGDRSTVSLYLDQAFAWLKRQPRRVRSTLYMICFFFLLNLFTSGLSSLWFIWPSLPFVLMLVWHYLVGNSGGRDEKTGGV